MSCAYWLVILLIISVPAYCSGERSPQDVAEPKIQFLGVGGWLLHWQGEGLLIAPSFTNPALLGIEGYPPLWVESNKSRIDQYMPYAQDVTLLLVGHGHYDHLLDVPWVMSKHTPRAKLYGSNSVAQMLKAMTMRPESEQWTWVDPGRVFSVEECMAKIRPKGGDPNSTVPGDWVYSSGAKIRVMPIESEHAGHIFGIDFVPGEYTTHLEKVPTSVFGWKPGQPLAWLIDLFNEKGELTYRIHYQDSASSPPYGLPPSLRDGKAIDVEILSVASWQQVEHYPDRLLRLTQPRLVLLGHWESFFGSDPYKPTPLRWQKEAAMVRAVRDNVPADTVIRMPNPFAQIAFPKARPGTGNSESSKVPRCVKGLLDSRSP
jgi:L-ascorbate metabolism protein UlaG (beta-lactamase superfamily)